MTGFTPAGARQFIANVVEGLAGVTLTSGAGVKGAWVQLDASVANKTVALIIAFRAANTTNPYFIDIGVGAAAAEVIVIADLMYDQISAVGLDMKIYRVVVEIPAGSRLAARVQATLNTDTIAIYVWEEQIA